MLSYGMTSYNEKKFYDSRNFAPRLSDKCEKVEKSQFVLFDFNSLTKRDWSESSF